MKSFEKNYGLFIEAGDLRPIQEAYNSLLVNREKEVRILGAKEEYNAFALGVNEEGELLIRREDGTIEAIYAGEVSVRGVYGYV